MDNYAEESMLLDSYPTRLGAAERLPLSLTRNMKYFYKVDGDCDGRWLHVCMCEIEV